MPQNYLGISQKKLYKIYMRKLQNYDELNQRITK